MVSSCCVVGCSNRQNKEKGIILHRFPKYPSWRRNTWINAVKRLTPGSTPSKAIPWEPSNSSRICNKHFIEGKPSEDPSHPDYVPTQNLNKTQIVSPKAVARYKRSNRRTATATTTSDTTQYNESVAATALLDLSAQEDLLKHTGMQTESMEETSKVIDMEKQLLSSENLIKYLEKRLAENSEKLRASKFCFANLTDKQITFHTGLPKSLFLWIYDEIEPFIKNKVVQHSLTRVDHLLVVLIKIRLGLLNRDLAYRFLISESSVSRILNIWIPIIANCLKSVICWPERDVARSNIPASFKPEYNKCISIIDCFEIFIERPKNLTTRAQTWSNYKNNNTSKYLISITPTGAINFISSGWGGRVSDKEITLKSGYMLKLLPGDEVLADRGFLDTEEMAAASVILRTPSFTRGKKQLSGKEVETSRKLSHVRIHVERVIGRMRTFLILESTIKICQVHLLDDIITIIAAMHNLMPSIVKS